MPETNDSVLDVAGIAAADARLQLGSAVARQLDRLTATPLAPGLHLVATPIGNLGDITLRALVTLMAADVIYCEDTRHSGTLLRHFAIRRPLRPYHEHNAARERPEILERLARGGRVALISDAGTPLVSDPGFKLVRSALEQGCTVTAVPGPSAALAALTASGLPTDRFLFAGFLPAKAALRRQRIAELAGVPSTLVLFETASRLPDSLADLAEILGPRPAAVARELTKLHEEMRRGRLDELAAATAGLIGEIVLVVAPPPAAEIGDSEILDVLRAELAGTSLRDAARQVAQRLGVSRSRVYDLGLGLAKEQQ